MRAGSTLLLVACLALVACVDGGGGDDGDGAPVPPAPLATDPPGHGIGEPPPPPGAAGFPQSQGRRLVARGSIWHYRADGVDAGSDWHSADASTWAAGDAPLGHGRDDLRTVIGGDASDPRPTTVYFLRHVREHPATALFLRVRCNAGFIAYLNGYEVARARMPEGPVSATTPATRSGAGDDFMVFDLTGFAAWRDWRDGPDQLAVEVHRGPGANDELVFDAELFGWGSMATHVTGGPEVARGSEWAFWTRPDELVADWNVRYPRDARWSVGPGPLGRGLPSVVSDVGVCEAGRPIPRHCPVREPAMTTYFVREIARDPEAKGLTAEILYHGGFIAYVNGVEVLRRGLPAGPVDARTPGTDQHTGGYQRFDCDAVLPLLRDGANVIAVEVHRPHAAAPVLFDLALHVDSAWRRLDSGTGEDLWQIGFWDRDRGVMLGGGAMIRRTADGGRTWNVAADRFGLYELEVLEDGTAWAAGGGGAMVTTDHGVTWTVAGPSPGTRIRDIHFVDREHGWMLGDDGLWRTTDGGTSWAVIGTGGARAIAFADPLRGWRILPTQYADLIERTDDGGVSWTRQPVSSPRYDSLARIIALSPTAVRALGSALGSSYFEQVTGDGGASWSKVPLQHQFYAATWLDEQRGWMVGEHSAILHTRDGGATWQREHGGTPYDGNVFDVSCLDELNCWAVGEGGLLLRSTKGALALPE